MRAIDLLTRDELLALAGLLRTIVLADRELDVYELDALDDVGRRVAVLGDHDGGAPYRTHPQAMGADAFRVLFGEACRSLPDAGSVEAALEAVVRPEAREAMFAIAHDVAAANGIVPAEQKILDWLLGRWELVLTPAPA